MTYYVTSHLSKNLQRKVKNVFYYYYTLITSNLTNKTDGL
nr:MAG TPA: hypothetical protein [Caudoviricetes sp.]